jgi:hypothetical protein
VPYTPPPGAAAGTPASAPATPPQGGEGEGN